MLAVPHHPAKGGTQPACKDGSVGGDRSANDRVSVGVQIFLVEFIQYSANRWRPSLWGLRPERNEIALRCFHTLIYVADQVSGIQADRQNLRLAAGEQGSTILNSFLLICPILPLYLGQRAVDGVAQNDVRACGADVLGPVCQTMSTRSMPVRRTAKSGCPTMRAATGLDCCSGNSGSESDCLGTFYRLKLIAPDPDPPRFWA